MSSQRKRYFTLNYTLLVRIFSVKVAEKNETKVCFYMHSLSFHNENFAVTVKKN